MNTFQIHRTPFYVEGSKDKSLDMSGLIYFLSLLMQELLNRALVVCYNGTHTQQTPETQGSLENPPSPCVSMDLHYLLQIYCVHTLLPLTLKRYSATFW